MVKVFLPKEILLGDIGHQFLLTWLMCNGYFHALPVWNVCSHPPQLSWCLGISAQLYSVAEQRMIPHSFQRVFYPMLWEKCFLLHILSPSADALKWKTCSQKDRNYQLIETNISEKYWKQTSRNKHIKMFCSATLCNILGMFNQGEDMIIPG